MTTTSDIAIRRAENSDIDTIAEFQCRLAEESEGMTLDIETVRKGVGGVVNNPMRGHYWLAEADGETIACLMILNEWSDWRNAAVWWIHSLYVVSHWRRRGVLRAMYEHLQGIVKTDDSLCGLRLYVEKDNHVAMSAYENLGMDGGHYKLYEWMCS